MFWIGLGFGWILGGGGLVGSSGALAVGVWGVTCGVRFG